MSESDEERDTPERVDRGAAAEDHLVGGLRALTWAARRRQQQVLRILHEAYLRDVGTVTEPQPPC